MRIENSRILLTAQHAMTEKHTRQESLVAGVTSTGAWNTEALASGSVRADERTQNLSGAKASPAGAPSSLLDEYLGSRSLESVERAVAAPADFSPRRIAAGAGGVEADLERLVQLASQEPRLSGLQDLARLVPEKGSFAPGLIERAAAAGMPLPDIDVLRQGMASLGAGQGDDLLSRLFGASLPMPLEGFAAFDTRTDPLDRLKMDLIRVAVAAFGGGDMRLLEPSDLNLSGLMGSYGAPAGAEAAAAEDSEASSEESPSGPAFGLSYSLRETHYERETTTFQAQGVVQTADGQEISVDVSLTMGRQFYSEESTEVRVGAALQDPLVVNFEGTAAELTERTFAFDLDRDGKSEQIHFVGPNSGFLAYDRNGNGAVDDGSELFGPATGQGFSELSNYDEDGNRFIDEADSVYDGLRIWQKDAGGNDRLLALGQAGVGAIYLGHTDTPFQVKDDQNQLQGAVKSSGVYLKENGGTGTVQQLDLVV